MKRVLNKITNKIYYTNEYDPILAQLPEYELVLIQDDNEDYVWNGKKAIKNTSGKFSSKKAEAHAVNKLKHEEFLNTPFVVIVKRDPVTNTVIIPADPNIEGSVDKETTTIEYRADLHLLLNGTDDTRFNIQSASEVAKEFGKVYFYDGLGVGDVLSLAEIRQVLMQFYNKVDPSFKIKGQTKLAINMVSTITELENIVQDILY